IEARYDVCGFRGILERRFTNLFGIAGESIRPSEMKRKSDRGKLWSRFFSRERFHGNVVFNFTRFPKGELAVYGRSYHEAAQHLIKHVASTHYRDPDACPIVFLYRHAVELYLKSIIHWGNNLLRLNGKPVVQHRHVFTEHRL